MPDEMWTYKLILDSKSGHLSDCTLYIPVAPSIGTSHLNYSVQKVYGDVDIIRSSDGHAIDIEQATL